MHIYYGLWKILLKMPIPLRFIFELAVIFALFAVLWIFLRHVVNVLCSVLKILIGMILALLRQSLPLFKSWTKRVYRWDEKLGLCGQAVYSKSNVLHEKIAKSKMISLLAKKEGWAIMAVIYLFAILPCFPIENMERAAQGTPGWLNRKLLAMEKSMTPDIDSYSDLFAATTLEMPIGEDIPEEEEYAEETIVYIKLNSETSYANIRSNPGLDSEVVGKVSREDLIRYQYEFYDDTERNWLKVAIETQDNLEGWISGNIIDKEIMDSLGLAVR